MSSFSLERSIYLGNIFVGILYGLELYMFCHSVYALYTNPSPIPRTRTAYVVYGGVMLLLLTIAFTTNIALGDLMWIEHRNVPGGPPAYFDENIAFWSNTFGTAADVATNIMGDGLLLYRCYMIWGSRWWMVLFPILIYIASTVLSIITVIEGALPGSNIFLGNAVTTTLCYVTLSVGLNVIVTIMICTRLLIMRRLATQALGSDASGVYVGIMAILVESALPFSLLGIGFVITDAIGSSVEVAFAFVWGTFCVLSPQLIILRVALGRGWSKETVAQVTGPPVFACPPSTSMHDHDSEGQVVHSMSMIRPFMRNSSDFTSSSLPTVDRSFKSNQSRSAIV